MLKAILLDIDGTLISSNDSHAKAWVEALQEEKIDADYASVRKAIGMGGDHMLPQLFKIDAKSDLGKRLSKKRGLIFREKYLSKLEQTPGAKDLLRSLKDKKLLLIVATSASEKDTSALLEQCGLEEFIDEITCSSDVDHSKPDPDIVLAALKRCSLEPSEAVMLGDTPYDVKAAHAAGVKIIGFTSGGWSVEDLKEAGADEVYADPQGLLRGLEESILRG